MIMTGIKFSKSRQVIAEFAFCRDILPEKSPNPGDKISRLKKKNSRILLDHTFLPGDFEISGIFHSGFFQDFQTFEFFSF